MSCTCVVDTLRKNYPGETVKQRVLVMNGRRILEHENEGKWTPKKVEPAGGLKPGIYNIYTAKPADTSTSHTGTVVFADKTSIVQQVGSGYIEHKRELFDKVPEIGSSKEISYDGGRASVTDAAVQSRKISR